MSKIKRLLNATYAYDVLVYESIQSGKFNGFSVNNGNVFVTFNPLTDGFYTMNGNQVPDTSVQDIALKRIKAKISNDLKQFKSLVPLAELKETRGLLKQVVNATSGVLGSLLEIKRNPKRGLKAAADAWLTFSFGVSPTISDINGAVNSIGSYLNREDLAIRHYGYANSHKSNVYHTTNAGGPTNGGIWSKSGRVDFDFRSSYSAGFRIPMKSNNQYGVDDHFGLSFGQLPSTLWELVPYSWVIDYFTTMGSFLEDNFETSPVPFYACRSDKTTVSFVSQIIDWTYSGKKSWTASPSKAKYVRFTRTPLSLLPSRTLRFKTADEIGVNGLKRMLNLGSLLVR